MDNNDKTQDTGNNNGKPEKRGDLSSLSIRSSGNGKKLSITETRVEDGGINIDPLDLRALQGGYNLSSTEDEPSIQEKVPGAYNPKAVDYGPTEFEKTFGIPESARGFINDPTSAANRSTEFYKFPGFGGTAKQAKSYGKEIRKGLDQTLYDLKVADQSLAEQIYITFNPASNGFKIGLGIIENVGLLGTLLWDDGDYDNAMASWARGYRKDIGENAPRWSGLQDVLRKNPNKVFDPWDSGFWLSNQQGLLESAGEFIATGAGVGSAFMKGATLAANALKLGATGTKLVTAGAQVASAGTLAYTEGAMTGAEVFKKVYDEHVFKNKKTPKEAREAAAAAAATTVHLNTTVNTFLNLSAIAPLFKNAKTMKDALTNQQKAAFKRLAGETNEAYAQRLIDLQWSRPGLLVRGQKYGREMLQEGVEELNNFWAQKQGEAVGADYFKKDGEKKFKDVNTLAKHLRRIGTLDNYFRKTFNAEGLMSFALGAYGGAAQTAGMRYMPSPFKKTAEVWTGEEALPPGVQIGDLKKDANGNIIYKRWKNAKYAEEQQQKVAFNQAKFALVEDLNKVNSTLNEMKNLVANEGPNPLTPGEIESRLKVLRHNLFTAESYRSIEGGWSENFKQSFNEIAELDNTVDLSAQLTEALEEKKKEYEEIKDNPEIDSNDKAIVFAEINKLEHFLNKGKVTEAMMAGVTESATDNTYKTKAEEAKKDLEDYEKIYQNIMYKHDYGDEGSKKFAKHLFNLKAAERKTEKAIAFNEALLDEHRSQATKYIDDKYKYDAFTLRDALDLTQEMIAVEKLANEYSKQVAEDMFGGNAADSKQFLESLRLRYPTEYNKLRLKHGDNETLINEKLFEKFKKDSENKVDSFQKRYNEISKRRAEIIKNLATSKALNEADDQGNRDVEDKLIQDNIEEIENDLGLTASIIDSSIQGAYDNLAKQKDELNNFRQGLKEIQSAKGRKNFIKAFTDFEKARYQAVMDEMERQEKAENKTDEKSESKQVKEPEVDEEGNVIDTSDTDSRGVESDPYQPTFTPDNKQIAENNYVHEFLKYLQSLNKDSFTLEEFQNEIDAFTHSGGDKLGILQNYSDFMNAFIEAQQGKSLDDQTKVVIRETWDKENPAYYDSDSNSITFVRKKLSSARYDFFNETFIHESIHALVDRQLFDKNEAAYKEVQDLILSLDSRKSTDLNTALSNIISDLKTQIDNESDLDKKEILKYAYKAFKYMQTSESHGHGVEEFVTQAFSEKHFAAYLNSIEHKNALIPEDGPKISVWQYFKNMVLSMVEAVTGHTKLQELSNILDKYVGMEFDNSAYQDLSDTSLFKQGLYKVNGKDAVVKINDEGNYVVEYPFTTHDSMTQVLTPEEWNNSEISFIDDSVLDNALKSLEGISTRENLDQFKQMLNDDAESIYYLSSENQVKLAEAVKEKEIELEGEPDDIKLKTFLADIAKSTQVTGIDLILAEAEFGVNKIGDPVSKSKLQDAAIAKKKELLKNSNSFVKAAPSLLNNDQFINNIKLVEDQVTNLIEEFKSKLELPTAGDLNYAKARATHGVIKQQLLNFSKSLNAQLKNNKITDEVHQQYLTTFKRIFNGAINEVDNMLLRKVQFKKGDKDLEIVTLIRPLSGEAIESTLDTKEKKLDFFAPYIVVNKTEDSYDLVKFNLMSLEKAENIDFDASEIITVKKELVNNLSSKKQMSGETKENIYSPDYINRMYTIQSNDISKLSPDFVKNLVGYTLIELRDVYQSNLTTAQKQARVNEITRQLKATYGATPSGTPFSESPRSITTKFVNDAYNFIKNGEKLKGERILELYKNHVEAISSFNFGASAGVKKLNIQEIIDTKVKTMKRLGESPNDIGKYIRIKVSKNMTINANKQLMQTLDLSDNALARDRFLSGIFSANRAKVASGNEFIGIHKWEQIDMGIELNIGTEEEPSWVFVGTPNNPKSFRRSNGAMSNTLEVVHPGTLLMEYKSTEDIKKKERILDRFNRLYMQNNSVPFTKETLEAYGENWNKLDQLFDLVEKAYDEAAIKGNEELILGPEQVKELFDISVTSGSINFAKSSDRRYNLSEVLNKDEFKLDGQLVVIDAYSDITAPIRDNHFNSEKEIKGDFASSTILGGKVAEELVDEIWELKLPAKDNRYWLLTRDINGKIRPIVLKPRIATDSEIEATLKDFSNQLSVLDNKLKNENVELVKEDGSSTSQMIDTLKDFEAILKGEKGNSNGLYIKVPPKFFGGRVDIRVSPVFSARNEKKKVIRNNELKDTNSIVISVIQKDENNDAKETTYHEISIKDVDSFKSDLKKEGLVFGNIGTNIPDTGVLASRDLKPEELASLFELPTTGKLFKGHNLMLEPKNEIQETTIKSGKLEEGDEITSKDKPESKKTTEETAETQSKQETTVKQESKEEIKEEVEEVEEVPETESKIGKTEPESFSREAVEEKLIDNEEEIAQLEDRIAEFNNSLEGSLLKVFLDSNYKLQSKDLKNASGVSKLPAGMANAKSTLLVETLANTLASDSTFPFTDEQAIYDAIVDLAKESLGLRSLYKEKSGENALKETIKENRELQRELKKYERSTYNNKHINEVGIIESRLENGSKVKITFNGRKYDAVYDGSNLVATKTNKKYSVRDILENEGKISFPRQKEIEPVVRPQTDNQIWNFIQTNKVYIKSNTDLSSGQLKSKVENWKALREAVIEDINTSGRIGYDIIEELGLENLTDKKAIKKVLANLDIVLMEDTRSPFGLPVSENLIRVEKPKTTEEIKPDVKPVEEEISEESSVESTEDDPSGDFKDTVDIILEVLFDETIDNVETDIKENLLESFDLEEEIVETIDELELAYKTGDEFKNTLKDNLEEFLKDESFRDVLKEYISERREEGEAETFLLSEEDLDNIYKKFECE